MHLQRFILILSEILLAVFQCVTGYGAVVAVMGRPAYTVAHTWPMLFSLQTGMACITLMVFIAVASTSSGGIECYGAARMVTRHLVIVSIVSFLLMVWSFGIVDDAKSHNLIDSATGGLRTGNAVSLGMFYTVDVYARWQLIMGVALLAAIWNVTRVVMSLVDAWNGLSHAGVGTRDARMKRKNGVRGDDTQKQLRRLASDGPAVMVI